MRPATNTFTKSENSNRTAADLQGFEKQDPKPELIIQTSKVRKLSNLTIDYTRKATRILHTYTLFININIEVYSVGNFLHNFHLLFLLGIK